jgi:predicted transcriptional regulator
MSRSEPVRGELQQEILRVLWATPSASVEEVRGALPKSRRGVYNTVQTVLNRLADRGLVNRSRDGRAIRYSAAISEADYLSRSMGSLLSGATPEGRLAALANLAEQLPESELDALRKRKRKRG